MGLTKKDLQEIATDVCGNSEKHGRSECQFATI